MSATKITRGYPFFRTHAPLRPPTQTIAVVLPNAKSIGVWGRFGFHQAKAQKDLMVQGQSSGEVQPGLDTWHSSAPGRGSGVLHMSLNHLVDPWGALFAMPEHLPPACFEIPPSHSPPQPGCSPTYQNHTKNPPTPLD